jgi:hypothetical protein
MSENLKPPMPEDASSAVVSEQSLNSGLSSEALARRRMLLKSLGKGSTAIAAVSVPMHSIAAIGTLSVTANGKRCTISGTMSGVHSNETVTAGCKGYAPSKYQTLANWPGYDVAANRATNTVDGITFAQQPVRGRTFSYVFGSGSNSNTLLAILVNSPGSDEAVWITALLNSIKVDASWNFPYSPSQVRSLYATGGQTSLNALAFFKGYMQTVN